MKDFEWSEELFRNPPAQFRGAPFWAWNGKLDQDVLRRQMDVMQEMGFGGWHMHSRIGLSTPYLGEDFMKAVRYCVEYGKSKEMLSYLYDEDKWPSGFGAGFVTGNNPDLCARHILFTKEPVQGDRIEGRRTISGHVMMSGPCRLLAAYDVVLSDGAIVSYRRLGPNEQASDGPRGMIWYAYEIVSDPSPWYNNTPYADLLNPEAAKRFAQLIYERYAEEIGEEFGKSVPTIFTDEPQFTRIQVLEDGRGKGEACIPSTIDMDALFREEKGYSLLDRLPEVFWDFADGTIGPVRYHFFDFITQRFADSYSGVMGAWCRAHGIGFTGHLMGEGSLDEQSRFVGECMRSYVYYDQPGMDMLADREEYMTAKQVQSVNHQMGRKTIMSELYGVTNWYFDFKGHKLQGDWQAALGITMRVPHLVWMYMGGESKRDYPAPIDDHSTWYKKYPLIEDHFARLGTILTHGTPKTKIAVLHPIESYWMLFGPDRENGAARQELERQFRALAEALLFGLLDFDYLSEGLLPKENVYAENGQLAVGAMRYDAVVIPPLVTIRRSTLKILSDFAAQGGKIYMLGKAPSYVDAMPSPNASFLDQMTFLGFDMDALVHALEPYRLVDAHYVKAGTRTQTLLSQVREADGKQYIFLAHGRADSCPPCMPPEEENGPAVEITFPGCRKVRLLDTMTGEILQPEAVSDGRSTAISVHLGAEESFLFELTEATEAYDDRRRPTGKKLLTEQYLPVPKSFITEEDNVLLLDMVSSYALDGKEMGGREEILRVDDAVRARLSMRRRTDAFPQPWLTGTDNPKDHEVTLRFAVVSKADVPAADLAFEGDTDVRIFWNGEEIRWEEGGSFIDRCIRRIPLGTVKKGENTLVMQIPFGVTTNLEWVYILGSFGVRAMGDRAVITERPQQLFYGDYTRQGFPFYGGNMVYETTFECPAGYAEIRFPHYAGTLLEVSVDGGAWIPAFTEPVHTDLGLLSAGEHSLRVRVYGNRFNTFGQLHNCNDTELYWGPKTWRTSSDAWCYEYRLREQGLTVAPIVRVFSDPEGGKTE